MSERNGSTRRWRTVRARVLRQSTVCWLCGKPDADSVDHVIPVSLGGPKYDPGNLRPACLDCNKRRGNRSPESVMPKVRPSRDW